MTLLLTCCFSAWAEPSDSAGREPSWAPGLASAAGDAPLAQSAGSFKAILTEAKQRYFGGESERARELLQGLALRVAAGEQADWPTVVDALTYLGEIHYVLGDNDQAADTFRVVLRKDPQTPISPYHHSIEVVNLFELVRNRVIAELANPPTTPVPAWTVAPFGAPQLLQGRTGRGVVYGLLQLGLGVGSIGVHIRLNQLNPETDAPNLNHPLWEQEEVTERVNQRRLYVQWPLTAAFYSVWAVSSLDAVVWHQRHPGSPRGAAGPSGAPAPPPPGTAPTMLQFNGRF